MSKLYKVTFMDRRKFIKKTAMFGTAPLIPNMGKDAGGSNDAIDLSKIKLPESSKLFTDEELRVLARLCEHVLPGSVEMGAIGYIETLLTAFDYDPPRIYAGGPWSGRNPFEPDTPNDLQNHFLDFVPLNRVQERTWKLKIFGADESDPLGPVRGLRPIIFDGIKEASRADENQSAWNYIDKECKNTLKELVLEGVLAAPEYGGNTDLKGWKFTKFEGDNIPFGYTKWDPVLQTNVEREDAPVSTPGPNSELKPLSFTTKLLLFFMSVFTGGRAFK